jgi:hypothetical protein
VWALVISSFELFAILPSRSPFSVPSESYMYIQLSGGSFEGVTGAGRLTAPTPHTTRPLTTTGKKIKNNKIKKKYINKIKIRK